MSVVALQSLIFGGGCALVFVGLRLAPRWVQLVVIGLGLCGAAIILAEAAHLLDAGLLLGGLMLMALFLSLNHVLLALRQPASPSGQAPGGAHAPGEAGERDGERHAPILPGGCTTAGRAGRPRAFSGNSR